MRREEIRGLIHEYFAGSPNAVLSEQLAEDLIRFLKGKFPDRPYGSKCLVEAKYFQVFKPNAIKGSVKWMDYVQTDHVNDSVDFTITAPDKIMVLGATSFALNLNMDRLSEDDLVDISYIGLTSKIDVFKTFMRIPPLKRELLTRMIENPMTVFGRDIPPYAFYRYDGQFDHQTDKGLGDLGGGVGFGGFYHELGSTLDINGCVEAIGEHAFDSCSNLKEVIIKRQPYYIGKHAFANTPGLIIRCYSKEKPASWDDEWCDANCKVMWGGVKNTF